jgi:hypothetical protein
MDELEYFTKWFDTESNQGLRYYIEERNFTVYKSNPRIDYQVFFSIRKNIRDENYGSISKRGLYIKDNVDEEVADEIREWYDSIMANYYLNRALKTDLKTNNKIEKRAKL